MAPYPAALGKFQIVAAGAVNHEWCNAQLLLFLFFLILSSILSFIFFLPTRGLTSYSVWRMAEECPPPCLRGKVPSNLNHSVILKYVRVEQYSELLKTR